MNEPLFVGKSDHGNYRVIDTIYNGRPSRILYGEGNSPQSGLALDDNQELLFDYNQRFMEIIMSHQPSKLLVIGGGTCTLPAAAHNLFSDLTIDVIEIDKLLVDLGYKFFDLPHSPRLRPIISDAFSYLATKRDLYDMIIIDAFTEYTIPPHLLQQEAILRYKNHLATSGVLALNFISDYKSGKQSLAHEIAASFSEVFPRLAVYQSDPDYTPGADQNHILVASDNEIHFDFLQSKEVQPA